MLTIPERRRARIRVVCHPVVGLCASALVHLDTSAAAGVSTPRDIHIVTLVVHHVKKWGPEGPEEADALSLSHLV